MKTLNLRNEILQGNTGEWVIDKSQKVKAVEILLVLEQEGYFDNENKYWNVFDEYTTATKIYVLNNPNKYILDNIVHLED